MGRDPTGRGTHMHNQRRRRSTKRARQSHNRSGAWLCELRKKHGLSQRELARRVGAEFYTVISQLEAGLGRIPPRSEEHTSELQSLRHLVCRLLLEKKNK